jgi:hypothetical protein
MQTPWQERFRLYTPTPVPGSRLVPRSSSSC